MENMDEMWNDMENTFHNFLLYFPFLFTNQLTFLRIFHIFSLLNLGFFHIFSLFSSNTEENCEMIWKICKKIVKRFGKYGRKVNWIVKWFGKYGNFTIQLIFLPYFPYHFTIFFHVFPIFSQFSSVFSISFH
jgi:hypothetical protein